MSDQNIDNVAAAAPEVVTAENPSVRPSEKPEIAAVEDVTRAHDGHKLDAAAELLRKTGADADNGRIVFTAEDNKRVLRKIDLVISPSSSLSISSRRSTRPLFRMPRSSI